MDRTSLSTRASRPLATAFHLDQETVGDTLCGYDSYPDGLLSSGRPSQAFPSSFVFSLGVVDSFSDADRTQLNVKPSSHSSLQKILLLLLTNYSSCHSINPFRMHTKPFSEEGLHKPKASDATAHTWIKMDTCGL